MSNNPNSQDMAWWNRGEKRNALADRITQINKISDPTTYTDEILTASRVFIVLLIAASALLGGMSYYQNFSISFPVEIAAFLALALTLAIEWGKNKAATWSVRIPFFQGWNSISRTPANTFVFGGLVLFACATFAMSVYNSTKGGEQLARMMAHEKTSKAFTPDTKQIDDQIAALNGNISNAPTVRWKGKNYYQDAKSVRENSKAISSLTAQKEKLVADQRADYERNLAVQSSQNNFAATLVLRSGGWIELLQILLIVIRVACEHKLHLRDGYGSASPTESRAKQETSDAYSAAHRTVISGFHSNDNRNTVPQTPQAVPQHNATVVMSVKEALQYYQSELQKEPSNFANKHADNETVARRIQDKLSRAENFIANVDALPPDAADRFKEYLTIKIFPVLEEHGYQYARKNNLIAAITQKSGADGNYR